MPRGSEKPGKSVALTILGKVLGDYALPIELDLLLEDKFSKANVIGKRIVILQDMPKEWKNFAKIKALTGEQETFSKNNFNPRWSNSRSFRHQC